MERVHKLKTAPEFFNKMVSGHKTFELRRADRDYQVGDWLYLEEYENGRYSGNSVIMQVSDIIANVYGLRDGFVLLLIDDISVKTTVYIKATDGPKKEKIGVLKWLGDLKHIGTANYVDVIWEGNTKGRGYPGCELKVRKIEHKLSSHLYNILEPTK